MNVVSVEGRDPFGENSWRHRGIGLDHVPSWMVEVPVARAQSCSEILRILHVLVWEDGSPVASPLCLSYGFESNFPTRGPVAESGEEESQDRWRQAQGLRLKRVAKVT